MINRTITVPLIWATLLLSVYSGSLFAQGKSADSRDRSYGNDQSKPVTDLTPWQQPTQPEGSHAKGKSANSHGRSFAVGQPKTIQDLPPGKLRKDLEALPVKARGKALGWLQKFEFPVEDLPSLRVNSQGEINYADSFLPEFIETPNDTASTAESTPIDPEQAFLLHSRPGASNVVYLDFDGHTFADTAWGSGEYTALPFDPSENDNPSTVASFTQDELNRIHEIWHRIAEDYAPFNIDVTTEEPGVFTPTTGHLLFTHDTDATGRAMPYQGLGGVAYVNVFGTVDYATRFSPTFVYYTNLSSSSHGLPNYTADAAAHEFGHNIGLSHDGLSGGTDYYEGHGSGLVSWAPIMGMLYYNNVTQWSKGEYPNANNLQDDVAILAADLGYVGDDHGDSAEQATALVIDPSGNILVSSPEVDPENLLTQNKGIIEDRNDTDWFYFDVDGSSTVTLTATPAWHSFPRSEKRGANLDIELSVFDSNLDLIDFDEPDDDTSAFVSFQVSQGRYFIQVDGTSNDTNSDYSDYASMGMYFLEGNAQIGLADSIPPSPSVMSWELAPTAVDSATINMISIPASDDSDSVEYYFSCVAGGSGCEDSGWQSGRSHTANGLSADTFYSYTVIARDASQNQNSASTPTGDTTVALAVNQAPTAVASFNPNPAVITKGKTASVILSGSGSSDPDGTITAYSWKDADGVNVSSSVLAEVKLREGTHVFTLTVTDNASAVSSSNLSVSVTAGGGGGGDDGGGDKPCNPKKKTCG